MTNYADGVGDAASFLRRLTRKVPGVDTQQVEAGNTARGVLMNMDDHHDTRGETGTYAQLSKLLSKQGSVFGPLALRVLLKTAAKKTGWYKGEPSSPDTVKFVRDFQGIKVKVDRPKGFKMSGTDSKGKPWTRTYKYDYGFIPKALGGDGDGLDVFIGPSKKANKAFWAIQRKPDGSFDEYKVFLGFDNRDEAIAVYRAHIPKKLLAGMTVLSIEMMKSMLGHTPDEKLTKKANIRLLVAGALPTTI